MKRLLFEVDGKQVRVELTLGMYNRLLRRFDWRKAHVRCAFCEDAVTEHKGCLECRLSQALRSAGIEPRTRRTPPCYSVPGAPHAILALGRTILGETDAHGIVDRFREHLIQWAERGEREKRDEKGAEHAKR